MKNTKTYLILILTGTVTFSMALWLYSTMEPLNTMAYTVIGLVIISVIFSLVIGLKRLKDEKKGMTPDDEMSYLIKLKAASNAFTYSFYLWLLIMFLFLDKDLDIEIPIGLGILGMGIIYIFNWIYYSKKGINSVN
ncbi:MAG: hypothetical protein OEM04_03525 [Flavobacteriaceae bacterium]|nr:hypothetical protein [Flavobacteriaceae bacterium]